MEIFHLLIRGIKNGSIMWHIIFKYPEDHTENITLTCLGLIIWNLLLKFSSAVKASVIKQSSPHIWKTAVHREYQFIPAKSGKKLIPHLLKILKMQAMITIRSIQYCHVLHFCIRSTTNTIVIASFSVGLMPYSTYFSTLTKNR